MRKTLRIERNAGLNKAWGARFQGAKCKIHPFSYTYRGYPERGSAVNKLKMREITAA
jgi:hypothetical protein